MDDPVRTYDDDYYYYYHDLMIFLSCFAGQVKKRHYDYTSTHICHSEAKRRHYQDQLRQHQNVELDVAGDWSSFPAGILDVVDQTGLHHHIIAVRLPTWDVPG